MIKGIALYGVNEHGWNGYFAVLVIPRGDHYERVGIVQLPDSAYCEKTSIILCDQGFRRLYYDELKHLPWDEHNATKEGRAIEETGWVSLFKTESILLG
jgi:hypothetical protein